VASCFRAARYWLFWLLFVATFALDQASKQIIWRTLPSGYDAPPVPLIPGVFNLVHVHNRGAAFSLFSGYGWLLVVLALGALVATFIWRRNLELERRAVQFAFGMLTGGIVGNVADRLLYGYVVDFLDVILPGYGHWPAFNIADAGICIGVLLYLVVSFRHPVVPKESAE
jgi:signal peptidase II